MNDSNLIDLLEKLDALYDTNHIVLPDGGYTPLFIALVGGVKDALSKIE